MKITLRPVGGLCNRMLCISSFISLSKDLEADLDIIWEKNNDLKAYFEELFEPIPSNYDHVNFIETDKRKLLFSDRLLNNPRQRAYNWLLKRYQQIHFNYVIHAQGVRKLKINNGDLSFLGKFENSYVTFWGSIGDYPFNANLFNPRQELKNSFPEIKEKYIGLHIRRSDHKLVAEETPIDKYKIVIEKELSKDEQKLFFLASDDSKIKKELTETYGDNIKVLSEKSASRDTVSGMFRALADLYTLAGAECIYGSPKSTFSIVGSFLGDISLNDISEY